MSSPRRSAAYWRASYALLILLIQDYQPRDGTAHRKLAPHTPIKKMSHRFVHRAIFCCSLFLNDSSLGQVDIELASTSNGLFNGSCLALSGTRYHLCFQYLQQGSGFTLNIKKEFKSISLKVTIKTITMTTTQKLLYFGILNST